MADFLTRLIERSRGLAPQGQQIEPLIAPFYAAGPNTTPTYEEMDGAVDEEPASVHEIESHSSMSERWDSAPIAAEALFVQRPEENISIAPSSQSREGKDKDRVEIRPARAPADETQNALPVQNSGIEPPPRSIVAKSPGALAEERPGLAEQSRRADRKPLAPRPRPSARADDSNSRAGEAANKGEAAESVIRVTIGRVDVRAVTPPAPPARRETPPTPKLSLEEYLRLRSGRK